MKRYLKYIFTTLTMSHQRWLAYRADYLAQLIRGMVEIFITLITIDIVFGPTSSIAGWSRAEAIIVYALAQTIMSFGYMIYGYGIDELFGNIITGRLDRHLVQPLDSQFTTSVNIPNIMNIFKVLSALAIIVYIWPQANHSITITQFILGFISIISASIIYYSLMFTSAMTAFWTFSDELPELTSTLASISHFPTDFFSGLAGKLLYIIPLGFLATVPATAILGRDYIFPLLSPFIAFICLLTTRYIWNLGLKSYSSASS